MGNRRVKNLDRQVKRFVYGFDHHWLASPLVPHGGCYHPISICSRHGLMTGSSGPCLATPVDDPNIISPNRICMSFTAVFEYLYIHRVHVALGHHLAVNNLWLHG